MVQTKRLLNERSKTKAAKPRFVVKESKFSARVKSRWRFPRGKHSAVRQMHRGRPAMPTPGYGSPSEVKGLDRSGLKPTVVHALKELESLNNKVEGAVIGSGVGARKKLSLLKVAQEKKITVLNFDVATQITQLEAQFEERKKKRAQKKQTRSQKEEEKKKKAKETKKEESAKEESVEQKLEQQEEQKKTIEKELTKRQ